MRQKLKIFVSLAYALIFLALAGFGVLHSQASALEEGPPGKGAAQEGDAREEATPIYSAEQNDKVPD